MTDEWNLSDKIEKIDCNLYRTEGEYISIEDVRKFVKRLKEDLLAPCQAEDWYAVKQVIVELAGEKLI